jgi:glyoxylase-like metal-dependent hydrolase (beta-lactamase superfamily II)
MAAAPPARITLRAYPVGFGDCFLLTFHYAARDRHVLIDFGTTAAFPRAPRDTMRRVAADVRARCNGKLHAVVATHRHQDHLSGFATSAKGNGTGDVIAACDPDVVIQPWTEDPAAASDAVEPTTARGVRGFLRTLSHMHVVAAGVRAEAEALAGRPHTGVETRLVDELRFLGEDNLSNRSRTSCAWGGGTPTSTTAAARGSAGSCRASR